MSDEPKIIDLPDLPDELKAEIMQYDYLVGKWAEKIFQAFGVPADALLRTKPTVYLNNLEEAGE